MNTEKQCIQAFNNGYLLEQYQPELLNVVTQNLISSNLYLKYLLAGKQQMKQEFKEYHLSELHELRKQVKDKNKDLGMEK